MVLCSFHALRGWFEVLDHLSLSGDTEQVLDEPFYPVGRLLDHLDVFLIAGPLVLIQVAAEDVELVSEVIAEDALVSAGGSARQRNLISPELWAEAALLDQQSASEERRWKISSEEKRSRTTVPTVGAPLRDRSTASRTCSCSGGSRSDCVCSGGLELPIISYAPLEELTV